MGIQIEELRGKRTWDFSFYEFMTQRIREGFERVRENYPYRIEGIFATDLCSPNSQQDNSKPTLEHGHSPTINSI
jgi:hypothetical protein